MPEQGNTSTSTLHSPDPVLINPIANEVSNPLPEIKKPAMDSKFSHEDILTIIFFATGIAVFVLAINYFNQKKKLIVSWQQDANDDIAYLKGKVGTLEKKVTPVIENAKTKINNEW